MIWTIGSGLIGGGFAVMLTSGSVLAVLGLAFTFFGALVLAGALEHVSASPSGTS